MLHNHNYKQTMAVLNKVVKNDSIGTDADLNGPFALEIGGKTASLHGSITIKAIVNTGMILTSVYYIQLL